MSEEDSPASLPGEPVSSALPVTTEELEDDELLPGLA